MNSLQTNHRTPIVSASRDAELRAIPVIAPILNDVTAPRRMQEEFAGKRMHFMGAGGIGISGLMELCAARGAIVSGCDCSGGGQVAALRAKGMVIENGHCADHANACDELIYSAAISTEHPEVERARSLNKAVGVRMNLLGRITRGTRAICVTGAHGKTSTTWLISHLLIAAGRDPSVLLGGVVKALSGNVRTGLGAELVVETDESDNKLHLVTPSIPVLTNIDNDHLENYGSVDAIEQACARFLSSLDCSDPMAVMIGCGDDVRVRRSLDTAKLRSRRASIAYGLAQYNQVRAVNVRPEGLGTRFDVLVPSGLWINLFLPMPGAHNVLNALAAISVAWHLGIDEATVRDALSSIERVGRRFEIKGTRRGVRVIDDYGHHPTEIEATLSAARQSTQKRLAVLFQPHRYSRTAALMEQFASAFIEADKVVLLPIYAASEAPLPGIDHHALARQIEAQGKVSVTAAGNRAEAVEVLLKWAADGDTIITQGAGDVTKASDEIVSRL